MGPVISTSLHHLKLATKDLHRALDRESGMVRLMAPDLRIDEYALILEKMLCIYALVEPVLLQAEKSMGALASWQPKAGWLALDLRQLKPNIVCSFSFTSAVTSPSINSLAELAGCLYVLEGATLGGQMIVKKLRQTLGSDVKNALRFFDAYGDTTAARWGATCEGIEKYLQHEDDLADACRKAREVFEVFITVMHPPLATPLKKYQQLEGLTT